MPAYGYLLDTNILSYLAYPIESPFRQQVNAKLSQVDPRCLLCISAISWGEIEYGWKTGMKKSLHDMNRKELDVFHPLNVSQRTGEAYAEVKARLFEKFGGDRWQKIRRVEQLRDPMTGAALGVDENDVWITAQAIEHKLILVSHDHMHNIRAVATQAGLIGFEDWPQP
jgi:predicted nucleic acid-binding protein